MLEYIVVYLFCISCFSFIHSKKKYDFLNALFVTFLTCSVFYLFLSEWQNAPDTLFSLIWDSSRSGDIKIDIFSNPQTYMLIFPFFCITILAMSDNLFFPYEQNKKTLLGLLILNLITLIMLISGNNFVQIITFVFVSDIIGQLLVKDIHASRRYSIYNLIADMALFLVLAMIRGKLENLDVGNISRYYETGRHRDFITVLIMISLFIKFGFFMFQGYLLDLKGARFHALILLPFLSTPAIALILFMKFYPLLIVSPTFIPLLNIFLVLSLFWGAVGCVLGDNLKEQSFYLNMIILSVLVKIVEQNSFQWNSSLSLMFISAFILNVSIYYTHYFTSRNSTLLKIEKRNTLAFSSVMLMGLCATCAFIVQFASLYNPSLKLWYIGFGILFTLSLSHMFRLRLNGQINQISDPYSDYRPLPFMSLCTALSVYIFYLEKNYYLWAVAGTVLFFLLFALYPFKKMTYFKSKWQQHSFSEIYEILLDKPITFIGKILTVLIDFVFIEKVLTGHILSLNGYIIQSFRKINRLGFLYFLICIIIAWMVLFFILIKGI